jgi:hypothetical protein
VAIHWSEGHGVGIGQLWTRIGLHEDEAHFWAKPAILWRIPLLPKSGVRGHEIIRAGVRRKNAHQALTASFPLGRPVIDELARQAVALPVAERELLAEFLRHGGQIISRERLAAILSINARELDRGVQALREELRGSGSTYLPYTVNGLGYILWQERASSVARRRVWLQLTTLLEAKH